MPFDGKRLVYGGFAPRRRGRLILRTTSLIRESIRGPNLRASDVRSLHLDRGRSMRTIRRQGGGPLSRTVTDEELAALVQRITEAAQALISGDIEGYATRIKHAHDYTLMSPYGGDPVRGFDDSDGALDALAQFFRGGEAKVEVVETYTSGDLAVLVVIERQHGTIGDLPEQDWSLRVTWVFRRTAESDWELVHRHADALVHAIDHERLGELARGE